MRKVKVELGERSYPILIGEKLLSRLGEKCRSLGFSKRCAVITDKNVSRLYSKAALKSLKAAGFDPILISVAAGETAKNLSVVHACYDELAEHRIERKSFVIALGGGVVGDLAGFVAASYLRGIGFVQVPTTLLAQVDSSVGGKVGVNLKAGKNLVGAFHQPRLVLCDLETLKTLPEREFRAGLAEVIKYGIIYDAKLFQKIERDLKGVLRQEPKILASIVARCCEIKADVVSQDETETGLRAILNFGHTIGHAIESISGYGKYLHGEAISIGQIAAAQLSSQTLGLSSTNVARIKTLLSKAGLPTTISLSKSQRKNLLRAMRLDKKVKNGEIKFVLVKKIGEAVFGQRVLDSMVEETLINL